MALPEKEPLPVLSSSSSSGFFPQASWDFGSQSWRWKTCCLMHRANTPPSWDPTTHAGKPSTCGTDSPLCPLSQEGLRTVNSGAETNTGLSHTFPRIILPSWWGLMHIAAGGTSTDPTIPFRSQSRPWSSPTQSRAPSPPPGPDLSLRSGGQEPWCWMQDPDRNHLWLCAHSWVPRWHEW